MPRKKSRKPILSKSTKEKAKKALKHIGGANDRFWNHVENPKPTVDLVGKRRFKKRKYKKK